MMDKELNSYIYNKELNKKQVNIIIRTTARNVCYVWHERV